MGDSVKLLPVQLILHVSKTSKPKKYSSFYNPIYMSLHKYYTTNIRVLDVQFIHLYSIYDQYFHHLNKNSQILEIGPGNGGFCVYLRNKF